MRSNNRITKLLIHTDIQLLTLHLIGICFHLNISLLNIDKINTPLLLLHGTVDTYVPIGESIQLFNALKI